ncbi:MAG: hypothetical protein JRI55_39770 [Deltaproteobacteria bacterium]|nr:hypothetical protein [Deltaproteobacteria bacterium]
MLASLPFYSPGSGLRINGHGLALWLTSPFYLLAFWPRRGRGLYTAAAVAAAAVALPNLLYQNTGWIQFGYRFSNDFALFLFLMIAASGRRLGRWFWLAAITAVLVNGFGAVTFGKADYQRFYFVDRTQKVLFAPD